MEGIPPAPRKPRSESRPRKKAKVEKNVKREPKRSKDMEETIKPETLDPGSVPATSEKELPGIKPEPFIKPEPIIKPEPFIKPEPLAEPFIKPEPVIKDEPMDEEPEKEVENDPPAARFADVTLSKRSASPLEKPVGQAYNAEYTPATTNIEGQIPQFAANMETQLVVKREPIESM